MLRRIMWMGLVGSIAAGCSPSKNGNNVTCGMGTSLKGSVCVADPTPGPGPGPAPNPNPNPNSTPTSVSLTYLSVKGDLSKPFNVDYPIDVEAGITSNGSPRTLTVSVGLIEKPAANAQPADLANLVSCTLDGIDVQVAGDGRQQVARAQLVIPPDCLPSDASNKTFNLWVDLDPQGDETDTPDDQRMIMLTALDQAKPRNAACRNSLDSKDTTTGCVYDLQVAASPGADVVIDKVALDSTIGVIWKQGASPATQAPEPSLRANIGLLALGKGADDADEAKLPGPVRLTYMLEPTSGGTAQPLMIDDAATHSHVDHLDISELDQDVGVQFGHDLFIEGALHDAVDTGAWANIGSFFVKACVAPQGWSFPAVVTKNGEAPGDGDHCGRVEVRLVKQTASPSNASEKVLQASDGRSYGDSSKISAGYKLTSTHNFTLKGVDSRSEASADLNGLMGSINLVRGWANAGTFIGKTDNYVDYGLSAFGISLGGDSSKAPTFTAMKDLNFSREQCVPFAYGIGIFSLNVKGCVSGAVGLAFDITTAAEDGPGAAPFDAALETGQVSATVKPYAKLGGKVDASVSAVVARAGAEANLSVFVLELPVTAKLQWGSLEGGIVKGSSGTTVQFTRQPVSGFVNLYVDTKGINMCKKWIVSYPCGFKWNRQLNHRLFELNNAQETFTLLDNTETWDLQ